MSILLTPISANIGDFLFQLPYSYLNNTRNLLCFITYFALPSFFSLSISTIEKRLSLSSLAHIYTQRDIDSQSTNDYSGGNALFSSLYYDWGLLYRVFFYAWKYLKSIKLKVMDFHLGFKNDIILNLLHQNTSMKIIWTCNFCNLVIVYSVVVTEFSIRTCSHCHVSWDLSTHLSATLPASTQIISLYRVFS